MFTYKISSERKERAVTFAGLAKNIKTCKINSNSPLDLEEVSSQSTPGPGANGFCMSSSEVRDETGNQFLDS